MEAPIRTALNQGKQTISAPKLMSPILTPMADIHSLSFVYCEDWYFPYSKGFIVAGYLEVHRTRCVLSSAWEKPSSLPSQPPKQRLLSVVEEESSAPEPLEEAVSPSAGNAYASTGRLEIKVQRQKLLFVDHLESPVLTQH